MSSKKRNKLGPDKCDDGNVDTVCTTKSEPYPTITLDFGKPVDIAQVIYASYVRAKCPVPYQKNFMVLHCC